MIKTRTRQIFNGLVEPQKTTKYGIIELLFLIVNMPKAKFNPISGKLDFVNKDSEISHDSIAGVSANDHHSSTNSLLDGSAHSDSVAQTVSRGSLIYGNATPKWDELIVGAANSVLWSDGTDVSWSAAPRLANIADTGGTNRITLATASPHLTLTGNVRVLPASGASNPSFGIGSGASVDNSHLLSAIATGTAPAGGYQIAQFNASSMSLTGSSQSFTAIIGSAPVTI